VAGPGQSAERKIRIPRPRLRGVLELLGDHPSKQGAAARPGAARRCSRTPATSADVAEVSPVGVPAATEQERRGQPRHAQRYRGPRSHRHAEPGKHRVEALEPTNVGAMETSSSTARWSGPAHGGRSLGSGRGGVQLERDSPECRQHHRRGQSAPDDSHTSRQPTVLLVSTPVPSAMQYWFYESIT
jgi:hypothetical protein